MEPKFIDVLESVDNLSLEEQETLIDIVRNRATEERRRRLLTDIEESRMSYREGKSREMTAEEIMKEAQS